MIGKNKKNINLPQNMSAHEFLHNKHYQIHKPINSITFTKFMIAKKEYNFTSKYECP